jgi:hypothetical protein
VAAILLAIWPDFPMPKSTTRAEQSINNWQAWSKAASIRVVSSPIAACSNLIVRKADSAKGVARVWLGFKVLLWLNTSPKAYYQIM